MFPLLRSRAVLLSLFSIGLFPSSVRAATFTVSALEDSGAGSLRQAVLDANATTEADTISFAPEASGTLTLTSGEIVISSDVTLTGPGADKLTLSGGNTSRIFNIKSGTSAFSGLKLTQGRAFGTAGVQGRATSGYAKGGAGGAGGSGQGGAIFNAGTLTLNNVILSDNTARGGAGGNGGDSTGLPSSPNPRPGYPGFPVPAGPCGDGGRGGDALGGAVYNSGTLNLVDTTLLDNRALGGDGGNGGLRKGTAKSGAGKGGNGGDAFGGGIYNIGFVTQSMTTFSGNQAKGGIGGLGSKTNVFTLGTDGVAGTGDGDDILTKALRAPILNSVKLTPDGPTDESPIRAIVDITNTSSLTPTLRFDWRRYRYSPEEDAQVVGFLDEKSDTLSTAGDSVLPGDLIVVFVTASYGDLKSPYQQASVTVVPNMEITSVSLTPQSPTKDDILTANVTVKADPGVTPTLSYVWTWDDLLGSTILPETGATLSLQDDIFHVGDVIKVKVVASYGQVYSQPQSASVTVAARPPQVQSLTLSPTAPLHDDPITATVIANAGDYASEGVTPDLSYAWTRTRQGVITTLDETSPTLSTAGDTAMVGDVITVTVIASVGEVHSQPQSASVTIQNSPISISSLSLKPSNPYTTDQMIVTVQTADPDKTRPFFSYVWTKNGAVVKTVTGSRNNQNFYDLKAPGHGDKGDVIEVTVIASDDPIAETATTATAKASATVRNSVPVLSMLTLTPAAPTPKNVVTCNFGSRDADEDKLTRIYKWKIGKKVLAAEKSLRLNLAKYPFVKAGDVVSLEMRLTDGEALSRTRIAQVTVVASQNQILAPTPSGSPSPEAPSEAKS